MRGEPHSYPWCNLEGVKTATVGKEQGSAKHLTTKNTQCDLLLCYLNPKEAKSSQSMEHFHNNAYKSHAVVMTSEIGFISFQEERERKKKKEKIKMISI